MLRKLRDEWRVFEVHCPSNATKTVIIGSYVFGLWKDKIGIEFTGVTR